MELNPLVLLTGVCSFVLQVGSNFECSTDSALIEAEYQKNPQGSMTFTVNGQSYVLDFAGTSQVRETFKMKILPESQCPSWMVEQLGLGGRLKSEV